MASVILTDQQQAESVIAGRTLQGHAEQLGCKHRFGYHGTKEHSLWQDINAQCGQHAAAINYRFDYEAGRVWSFHAPDLGKKTQVRTITSRNYRLSIYDDDNDDEFFILVFGVYPNPRYEVIGHILGRRGKLPQWYGTYRKDRPQKLYRVPQWALTKAPPICLA